MRSRSLVALLLIGCQVYDPALVERDAGQNGACDGRRPPPRPDVADGPDVDELVIGLRDVVLDQEGDDLWRDMGFNLDGYCTSPPESARECEPAGTSRPVSDGNDGVDNTFGSDLFPLVNATVPGLEETSRAAQLAGNGLPVLRIRRWNGLADDPRVEVTITQAVATAPANADGSAPDIVIEDFLAENPDGTPADPPLWDGRDYAWMRADTFLAGDPDQPLVSDDNAYIANNMVVVSLPDRVEILFSADNAGVMVRLTGGLAVGTLNAERTLMENVIVGGRWSVLDLLQTAENVGVCMDTPEYRVLNARLDAIVDVRSDVGSGGPGVECDAISLGVGFTGFRMNWGGVTEGRPLVSLCSMMQTDGGVTDPDAGMDAGMTVLPDAGMDAGMPFDAGPI
jgi:hypothetical protein